MEIDKVRRNLFKFAAIFGCSALLAKIVRADALTDMLSHTLPQTQPGSKLIESNAVAAFATDYMHLNQIIAVRVWPSSVYTRIAIEARSHIDANCAGSTTDSGILMVDIHNAALNTVLQSIAAKILQEDPIISDIQVGQYTNDTVRLIIYLKQAVRIQTRSIEPVSLANVSYQYRYVLDMYPAKAVTTDNITKIVTEQNSAEGLNDDMLALLELGSDGTQLGAIGGTNSHIATKSAANSIMPNSSSHKLTRIKKQDKFLVMIDPGHGGEDPGAIGPMGTQEKRVVLDIAKKLYDNIQSSQHMQASLTRNQDIFIPLGTRVAIARRARADIFISVHADAFTTPDAHGSSVFILSNKGASSSFARWLAHTQNAADLIGGMSFKSKDSLTSRVLLDMTQTWSLHKSDELAQQLITNLLTVGKPHNIHVERAAFAVLKAPDIPSVLVETAFISNPYEEEQLQKPEFREKIALAVFSGINNYAANTMFSS